MYDFQARTFLTPDVGSFSGASSHVKGINGLQGCGPASLNDTDSRFSRLSPNWHFHLSLSSGGGWRTVGIQSIVWESRTKSLLACGTAAFHFRLRIAANLYLSVKTD